MQLIDEKLVSCKNNGCKVRKLPWLIDDHLKTCLFTAIACPWRSADFKPTLENVSNHFKSFHPNSNWTHRGIEKASAFKSKMKLVEIGQGLVLIERISDINTEGGSFVILAITFLENPLIPQSMLGQQVCFQAFAKYMTICTTLKAQSLRSWSLKSHQTTSIVVPLEADLQVKTTQNAIEGKLKKGDLLEALDTVQKWLHAQVKGINGEFAQIHFLGWPKKWDEHILMSNESRLRKISWMNLSLKQQMDIETD